jgi:hypothetical protein
VAKQRQAATIGGKSGSSPLRRGSTEETGRQDVTSFLSGATARAFLVSALVMLPALAVPGIAADAAQVLILLALFAGVTVFAEYSSSYPGLVEFRFAAPYNRTRFALLAVIVFLLSMVLRDSTVPGMISEFVAIIAVACSALLDFGFSPATLLVAALPDNAPAAHLIAVHQGASLALMVAATAAAGFAVAVRLNAWPMGAGPFNVWINLPTFDPTGGNDVVDRLARHARINVILGIALPFLLPGVVVASAVLIQPVTLGSTIGFVWGIALWAFVPASLVMRGIAMGRVARLIRESRRRYRESDDERLVTT